MKTKLKILLVGSLVLAALMLSSCSDFLRPEDNKDGGVGLVKIMVGSPDDVTIVNANAQASARTFLPVSSEGVYDFEFNSVPAGKQTLFKKKTLSGGEFTGELETGTWTVAVTRFELVSGIYVPVASGSGSTSFTVNSSPAASASASVTLAALPGVGSFTYKITGPASTTAELVVKQGMLTYTFQSITYGNTYTVNNVSSGSYEVLVSLSHNSDGRGTGDYSAAIVYPGLTTPIVFDFTDANLVSDVCLAGTVVIDGSPLIPLASGDNTTVTAYNTANEAIFFSSEPFDLSVPGAEWVIAIPWNVTEVRLAVAVTDDDSNTYFEPNALTLNMRTEVPVIGRDDLELHIGIYSANPSFSAAPPGDSIALSGSLSYFTAGERVDLSLTSTYGLMPNSLCANTNSGSIPVFGSGTAYHFDMPAENVVSLSASFFTADLADLSVVSDLGSETLVQIGSSDNYTVTVSLSATEVTVSATALEELDLDGAVVSGTGSFGEHTSPAPLTPGQEYLITIYVDTPFTLGGFGTPRVYTITVLWEAAP